MSSNPSNQTPEIEESASEHIPSTNQPTHYRKNELPKVIKKSQVQLPIKFYSSIDHLEENNMMKKVEDKLFYVEEKMDGSQLGFMLHPDPSHSGKMLFFNKKQILSPEVVVYRKAVMTLPVIAGKLDPDLVYHGESMPAPKSNVVVYDRTPKYFFILYDVYSNKLQRWYNYHEKKAEADRIGIECVPLLYMQAASQENTNEEAEQRAFDVCNEIVRKIEAGEITSCLGGTPEGVIVKRGATRYKRVSKAFKEKQAVKQKKHIFTILDFFEYIGSQYDVHPRFQKALQHLREDETDVTLENLQRELDQDLFKEYAIEIDAYIKAQTIQYIKSAWTQANQQKILNAIQDSEAKKIFLRAAELKLEFVPATQGIGMYGPLEDQIYEELIPKYRVVIAEYARKGLNEWFESKKQEISNFESYY